MKKELAEEFNQEVDNYRKALIYYAQKRDWETFQDKAGRMFDYIESIEFKELERRFFTVFNLILSLLILAVILLFSVDFQVHQELLRLKTVFILSAIAVSSFELYFFIDYRLYAEIKTLSYKKRRDLFVRNIAQDFSSYAAQSEQKAA